MSAHAFWATSGCQSLSLVGESVSHQVSMPPTSRAIATILRQNGLTNTSAVADAIARRPATILFASPNGASNHTAPNAQAIAMMAAGRMSDAPIHRMTRIRLHYKRSVKLTPPYPMAARHRPKVQYPARSSSDDIELYDNHPFLRNGSIDRQAPTSGPH